MSQRWFSIGWPVPVSYELGGTSRSHLPGIRNCSGCGQTWAGGSSYPEVEPPSAIRHPEVGPVVFSEYLVIRDRVRREVPNYVRLEPGTEFGPFLAKLYSGSITDMAFYAHRVFCREQLLERLHHEGVRVPPVVRVLSETMKPFLDLFELVIPYLAEIDPSSIDKRLAKVCEVCGRAGWTVSNPAMRAADAPEGVDWFRFHTAEWAVCSERVATVCRELGVKGIAFRPLRVI